MLHAPPYRNTPVTGMYIPSGIIRASPAAMPPAISQERKLLLLASRRTTFSRDRFRPFCPRHARHYRSRAAQSSMPSACSSHTQIYRYLSNGPPIPFGGTRHLGLSTLDQRAKFLFLQPAWGARPQATEEGGGNFDHGRLLLAAAAFFRCRRSRRLRPSVSPACAAFGFPSSSSSVCV